MLKIKELIENFNKKELKKQNHDFNVIVKKLNGLQKSIIEYIGR